MTGSLHLCKCCRQPLRVRTQPALIPGRADLIQIECINPDCRIVDVTVYGFDAHQAIDLSQWNQSALIHGGRS